MSSQPGAAVGVPVKVNGTKAVFMVDTGGAISMLSERIADAQGLSREWSSAEIYAADGALLRYYTTVNELDIGALPAKDVHLLLMPSKTRTGTGGLDGILGPDFLMNFDLDFDFGGHTFNLFARSDCGRGVVYWSRRAGVVPITVEGYHIAVNVMLDGQRFRAVIDTGASGTLINAAEARRRFDLEPGSPGLEKLPGSGKNALVRYAHRFKTLTIGDVTVNSPRIALLPDDMNKSFQRQHSNTEAGSLIAPRMEGPEMIIGMDVLSKLHMYISYAHHTLYVTPAGVGHPAAAAKGATASADWASAN